MTKTITTTTCTHGDCSLPSEGDHTFCLYHKLAAKLDADCAGRTRPEPVSSVTSQLTAAHKATLGRRELN